MDITTNDSSRAGFKFLGRGPSEWLLSLPVFSLLLLTLIIGTGEMFHGQLLRSGEKIFGDPSTGIQYFMMRGDPSKPDCNANPDVDAEVAKATASSSAPVDAIDALFAGPSDPVAVRNSIIKAAELCKEKVAMYTNIKAHITPGVRAYRTFETAFFYIFHFGTENRSLVLLLMVFIAAISTTLNVHHLALRPPKTRTDYKVYGVMMIAANSMLTFQFWEHLQISLDSGIPLDKPLLYYVWIAMFASLTLISVMKLVRIPASATPGGEIGMAFLSVPLFASMSLIGGTYFVVHGHISAQGIYLNQMMEFSGIFLNLALYIWAGMLLKQTKVVDRFLDILRPWKFSPEMLTYLILLGAALPTAYTGASGIFVIAAGAIIYKEVHNSGASRQFALAATAMSGSLGVVLRPCLLVVLIAALNKQVTTSLLYYWGTWVFILTSTLFLIVAMITSTHKTELESPKVALPGMLRALKPVIPYVIVVFAVIMSYKLLLNTKLDEFTAAVIMPVIMIVLVIFDRMQKPDAPKAGFVDRRSLSNNPGTPELRAASTEVPVTHGAKAVEKSVRYATNETIGHIGALIVLMALSLSIGGMVERSGIMEHAPQHFSSVWMAMTFLMITKVILGMIMDPFGAVILVSSTLAPIAYANGIDPIHFWMMVLVAFELGYLLPPVALNQLLTRQVVGEEEIEEADAEVAHLPFFRRYERWVLPVIVLSIGMLIVAYGPLIVIGK